MAATVRVEEWDRDSRLAELGLNRDLLVEVVVACLAAHGGCTANDPPMARGWEVYRWGVRRLREMLLPVGWEKDDTGGFSTVVNHDLKIRLAFMNTDDGTCAIERSPVNRSRKGPNSERAAATNDAMLPGIEWPSVRADGTRPSADDYATWHMCVHIDGDLVRAELAMFSGFEAGHFTDCFERIFLINGAEWDGPTVRPDDDIGPDVEVQIRRK